MEAHADLCQPFGGRVGYFPSGVCPFKEKEGSRSQRRIRTWSLPSAIIGQRKPVYPVGFHRVFGTYSWDFGSLQVDLDSSALVVPVW